jgi:hypothetical protein
VQSSSPPDGFSVILDTMACCTSSEASSPLNLWIKSSFASARFGSLPDSRHFIQFCRSAACHFSAIRNFFAAPSSFFLVVLFELLQGGWRLGGGRDYNISNSGSRAFDGPGLKSCPLLLFLHANVRRTVSGSGMGVEFVAMDYEERGILVQLLKGLTR